MVDKLKLINHELNNLKKNHWLNYDQYSLTILQRLLENRPYLPLNGMAMSAYGLAYIINEVVINNRRSVIEFGSGISTILLARLAEINKINLHITTVDDDKNWINLLTNLLKEENLLDFVTLIHSPLIHKCWHNLNNLQWYDLSENIFLNKSFDMLIVDGPKAMIYQIEMNRYPALPFIHKFMSDHFTIFLDDTNRNGEKKILDLWSDLDKQIQFRICGERIGVGRKGNYFESDPL